MVPVLVAGRNPVGFRQQRLDPLIWAVAEPAGEPGRVTAAVLRASVRHTGAFPNSARLVRVSCLECVFRVHASVVPPV